MPLLDSYKYLRIGNANLEKSLKRGNPKEVGNKVFFLPVLPPLDLLIKRSKVS